MKKSKKEVHDEARRLCRELRQRMTKAESIFWEVVRDRRFLGKKFSRQYPIFHELAGSYKFHMVDFYCHEDKTAVELDGSSHEGKEAEDKERSEIIEANLIRVVRFRNEEVEGDTAEVLQQLKGFMADSSPQPPSLEREGGESNGG